MSHFGQPPEYDSDGVLLALNSEVGVSIATKKNFHFITGYVRRCSLASGQWECDEDILYMRIKVNNGVFQMTTYDVQGENDRGSAIVYRKIGNRKRVFIAGDTKTTDVLAPSSGGTSDDTFLLELKPSGNIIKFELFGTSQTNEFDVAGLTLSHGDKNVVMLSNTVLNSPSGPICEDVTGPWLIERYNFIQEQCRDAEYAIEKVPYEASQLEAEEEVMSTEVEEIVLIGVDVELDQWTMCPKHGIV